MRCALLLLAVMLAVPAQTVRYELRGRLKPGVRASVWLHGAITPFDDGTLSDDEGRFRFRDLPAGAYTLGAFVPGRGEMRRTIEVGPSLADAKGRIDLVVDLESAPFESHDSLRRGAVVSARELAIPERANREYVEAAKSLNRRDVEGAVAHLKRAVEIAPQFAAAWNYLGTIAYQTHDFKGAETYFRRGLEADPQAYEPLVNLGGVLVNLQKFDEALQYNRHAVLTRPNDALANAQLGMTYFYLGNAELSRKYLTAATRIDPGHFSHPQLMLAEIDIRQGDRAAAARELEEFLKYHPDWPEAAKLKEHIARLRQPAALSAQAAAPAADPAQAYAATGMARSFSTSPDLPLVDDFADAPAQGGPVLPTEPRRLGPHRRGECRWRSRLRKARPRAVEPRRRRPLDRTAAHLVHGERRPLGRQPGFREPAAARLRPRGPRRMPLLPHHADGRSPRPDRLRTVPQRREALAGGLPSVPRAEPCPRFRPRPGPRRRRPVGSQQRRLPAFSVTMLSGRGRQAHLYDLSSAAHLLQDSGGIPAGLPGLSPDHA
jgi:tetratricopeptide (TPR) repeat protein